MSTLTPPVPARPPEKFPRLLEVPESSLEQPTVHTVVRMIYNTVARAFHDPLAMLVGGGFVALMLWGGDGRVELVGVFWKGWAPFIDRGGVPTVIPGVPWDQEWLAYAAGVLLVVVLPALLIRYGFRQDLRDYGLGLPRRDRLRLTLVSSALLFAVSIPAFLIAARDPGMRATYPLYRGSFESLGDFAVYEAGYFAFFVAIEFIFRGYLLFGVYRFIRDRGGQGAGGPILFGYNAIFISMLGYTASHLGKPLPELWGTLLWGVAAGTVVLATRSIWGIVVVHWLLNVLLDLVIWKDLL